jgi:Zn-dependent protease with chaperone function
MAEAAALVLLAGLAVPPRPAARAGEPSGGGRHMAGCAEPPALIVVGLALSALLLLPATPVFHRVTGWSAHEIIASVRVDLSGEPVAHGAALGPATLVVLALFVFAVTLARGALALRRELRRRAIGRGPLDSVVIADQSPLVAVPGVGRARIILSAPALAELDPDELDACLAHEAAHLRRSHRLFGLVAACLAVIARPVPGARAAERGLRLSLERDADEYAVDRTGRPLALASAICKLAAAPTSSLARGPLALGLNGAGAARARLDALLGGGRLRAGARLERAALLLGICLPLLVAGSALTFALWLAAAAPPAALTAAVTCGG